ncbi:MAG: PQQ-like beta-propeller repeat protein [Myxococcales bacterium]|nr:PQQ-like beta-propeller repeat protein [Myxococcales bacterium]
MLACLAVLGTVTGCTTTGASSYGWLEGRNPAYQRALPTGEVQVRWARDLDSIFLHTSLYKGLYVPVEPARAALSATLDRIYVGTRAGTLYAFTSRRREVFRYDAGAGIEAAPAVDSARGELYLADASGAVHALDAQTGKRLWRVDGVGGVGNAPVLTADAVYIVTENDRVVALSRKDGSALWTYRREPHAGFSVAGHAGLTLSEGRLLTGFTDGVVAALDASDGSVLWETDTSVDVPDRGGVAARLVDVDTTPVVVGGSVYVASFDGGLYTLSFSNGTVEARDAARTGVTGITASRRWLILASAQTGLTVLDRADGKVYWARTLPAGAPTDAVVTRRGVVLVGQSRGSLIGFELDTGREVGRIESGNGFAAAAVADGAVGAVLTNGGRLLVLAL